MGPVHGDAIRIDRFLHDRELTAVVGLPCPTRSGERTVQLHRDSRDRVSTWMLVVVNGLYPERFTSGDV